MTTWHLLGKFALGLRCANDDRLLKLVSANRLVVSSTRFQHPCDIVWNEIDHMLVRSRWASSAIDCRVFNVTQTVSEHGSDHAMVRARVRLRMKAARLFSPLALDWARVN